MFEQIYFWKNPKTLPEPLDKKIRTTKVFNLEKGRGSPRNECMELTGIAERETKKNKMSEARNLAEWNYVASFRYKKLLDLPDIENIISKFIFRQKGLAIKKAWGQSRCKSARPRFKEAVIMPILLFQHLFGSWGMSQNEIQNAKVRHYAFAYYSKSTFPTLMVKFAYQTIFWLQNMYYCSRKIFRLSK